MTQGIVPEPYCSAEDLEPEFRVVVRGGNRRGVRMEHRFWETLKGLAESRKLTLGQAVEEISRLHPESHNLTSAIRVACVRWLSDENTVLRQLASLKALSSVLEACPSPALALNSSKVILTFNRAFHQFVRRNLLGAKETGFPDQLKIGLDISVDEIRSRIARNDEPILTGFVVAAADRVHRAQLSMVKAPASDRGLLLAFVSSG
ncbi:ribbon-helix-helix domain-containing protein [Mesorhizobium sp. VNQ89]|uniref:ribbon-helix-helix domain-containing protein n=1 Tax=Mesorhizobium quangtriensis TaxID=3157709 RepID=UPI0032B7B06D